MPSVGCEYVKVLGPGLATGGLHWAGQHRKHLPHTLLGVKVQVGRHSFITWFPSVNFLLENRLVAKQTVRGKTKL